MTGPRLAEDGWRCLRAGVIVVLGGHIFVLAHFAHPMCIFVLTLSNRFAIVCTHEGGTLKLGALDAGGLGVSARTEECARAGTVQASKRVQATLAPWQAERALAGN
jgi:hypothetical protein